MPQKTLLVLLLQINSMHNVNLWINVCEQIAARTILNLFLF